MTMSELTRDKYLVQIAQELAATFHAGQVDKAGEEYFFHALRVSIAGRTEAEQVLGAIHDLLEDTHVSPSLLRKYFGEEIMTALAAITHEPGETNRAYLERVNRNPLAKAVKIHDIHDNLGRLHKLDGPVAERLRVKYTRALEQLGAM